MKPAADGVKAAPSKVLQCKIGPSLIGNYYHSIVLMYLTYQDSEAIVFLTEHDNFSSVELNQEFNFKGYKMLAINGVDHINMNVKNLKNSLEFYQRLFKNTEIKEAGTNGFGNPYSILGIDRKLYLCLYQQEKMHQDSGPLNHIGINVSNFNQVVNELMKLKIPLLYGGIVEYPNSQSIYITDPDGNEIEFSSQFGGGLD